MITENQNITKNQIPFWKQYNLTVEEAAKYFRIGENKLRDLIKADKTANYILWNGTKALIKRHLFENFIDNAEAI